MTPRPPGPTWFTELRRPWREIAADHGRGLLPILRSRFDRFGDIVYATTVTGRPLYSIRHPDHVHEVLVTRARDFTKRREDLAPYLGNGLLTSDGEFWREQRRRIQPAFSKTNLARYAEIMVARATEMISTWSPGERRDVSREMMEVTLSAVAEALLGYEARQDVANVAHAMSIIQATAGLPNPFPDWVPTPIRRRQKEAIGALDAIILPLIEARQQDPSGDDLLSQLLRPVDEAPPMATEQVRDEIVTLFLAGHETTALALTWALFLLSENPERERTLHSEVDQVLGARAPNYEDLDELVYTRLVVQESLRLFPPLYLLPRVAQCDTEVGGYPLKKGAQVLIWVYFMQRDSRWFPGAAEFRPARFLPDSGGVRDARAYVPFGAGPRACIGRNFANIEATLMLATIVQRFAPRVAPGQDIRMNPRVTLGPQFPIEMELEPRRARNP